MKIDVNNIDNDLNIVLDGRLDSTTSSELEQVLEDNLNQDIKSLNINLKNVDFISSKGLRILVGAYHKLIGKPITLTDVNPSVKEVIRLSGLLKIFDVQ